MSPVRTRLLAALSLTLTLGACADDEAPSPDIAALMKEAERIRELRFVTSPRVETRDPNEFVATSAQQTRALTDREVARDLAVWGRLGYYPPGFDLRGTGAAVASTVAAYYDPEDKALVLFDPTAKGTIVHELVHALQDQTFDLYASSVDGTSDAQLARAAVVEGDATLCGARYQLRGQSDPLRAITDRLDAVGTSEDVLGDDTSPALLRARAGIAYTFGSGAVARVAGFYEPTPVFRRERVDALFRDARPGTTEEILRTSLGLPIDPRVDVGLRAVPAPLADRYEIEEVDRLGAWLSYVLLRRFADRAAMRELALGWDGDQLVVIRPHTLESPSLLPLPVAVVWTSSWDDAATASRVATELVRVQGARRAEGDDARAFVAADDQPLWIEPSEERVVFVKGIPYADMAALAAEALAAR